jgi:hypothetical protein
VYLDGGLRPGTQVVTEGRAVLADGDAVAPKMVAFGAEDREDGSREAKE